MTLVPLLDRLAGAQLVRASDEPDQTFLFKHTLTQETAYASLLHKRRAEIHLEVARAYERLYPDHMDEYAALLAQHYRRGGDLDKTLVYALRAGDQSARIQAHAEAIEHYTLALDIAQARRDELDLVCELYLKRGRQMELSGRHGEALEGYRDLERRGHEAGEQRMELAALMAQTTLHSIPTHFYDTALAQRLADRSLNLARSLGDRAAESKILWNLMLLHSRLELDVPAAIASGEQSLALARDLGLTEQLAYTLSDMAAIYFFTGRAETAESAIQEALTLWETLDNLPMLASTHSYAAMGHLAQGNFTRAIADAEQAHELARRIGDPWGQAFSSTWVGRAYVEVGEIARAFEVMEEALALAEKAGFMAPQVMTRADLAALYSEIGQVERSALHAQQALDLVSTTYNSAMSFAAGRTARIKLANGELELASELITRGWRGIQRDRQTLFFSSSLYVAEGELALARDETEKADGLFEQLVLIQLQQGLAQDLPIALLRQGEARIRLGRMDQARASLERAEAAALSNNSRWILWRILLARAGLAQTTGEQGRSLDLRRRARETVDYILERTPSDLRDSLRETYYSAGGSFE